MINASPSAQPTYGNRMLEALPQLEADRLAPFLRRVYLQRDQVMQRPCERTAYLHFPIDAFAWAFTESTSGERPTSVLTVGRCGVIEWNRVLESEQGQTCVTIVSPGAAWRLPVAIFEQLPLQSALRKLMLRYANSCILNSAIRLACNSEHNVDQRLARWLLWVADESAHSEFSITHQQIAEIAAIRRPSVSLALSHFQRKGLVRSQHGRLRILDRRAFEAMVCACYGRIRENCDAVFEK